MSYSYPKVSGETVFAKDPADGKVKLLDTILQLLRTADSGMVNQINQALQAITQINTDIAGVWKSGQSNLPAANNTYDIGSASQMIRSIYSMGMTLGREGYEWEINSNDGYVLLASNVMLQWKKMTSLGNWNGGEWDPTTCTFPVPFSATPYWCGITLQKDDDHRDNEWYGFLYGGTRASQHPGIALSKSYCVFSARRIFTAARIIAIGPS